MGGADVGDEGPAGAGQGAEVALDLNGVPEVIGLAEEGAKADGHGRGDGAFAKDDLVDGPGRHADGPRHGILGNGHGLEIFLQKDFAGSDGWLHGHNVTRYRWGSMVIDDGDVGRAGLSPAEDDAPLVIDAYGVEAAEAAEQGLQAVARGHGEVVEHAHPVHLNELPKRNAGDGGESTVGLGVKKLLGIAVCKGLDHAGGRERDYGL